MATRLTTTRQERGQEIAQLEGQIKRIDANTYEVLSQSGNGKYEVLNTSIGWMCQYPDHVYRGVQCKQYSRGLNLTSSQSRSSHTQN